MGPINNKNKNLKPKHEKPKTQKEKAADKINEKEAQKAAANEELQKVVFGKRRR